MGTIKEDRPKRQFDGLSPSSLSLYQSCQRKFYLKKIAAVDPDPDAEDNVESLNLGKAFHKILEDCRHDLKGLSVGTIRLAVAAFGLSDDLHSPLLFAMLRRYKEMHERSGLKVLHCEVPVETETFFGIVDVVLKDSQGGWWIGDMKTAASLSPLLVPTLTRHPQINLYAAHAHLLAHNLELAPSLFRGCRYRLSTKSKLKRTKGEEFKPYADRIYSAVRAYDFILPVEKLEPEKALDLQADVNYCVAAYRDEGDYPPNFSACTSYFRPCEYWSHCYGKTHTELKEIDVVMSN